jgi:predicted RNA-binding protein with PIN domain
MKEVLLVDGYNIINAWPELKDILRDSIESARNRLVEIMAEYQAFKGIKVVVVFDGHLVKGNTGTVTEANGVKVVYTKENETADSYIERNVKLMSRRCLVKVATSDWTEQQVIMAMGGIRVSASELRNAVDGAHRDIRRKILERGKNRINTVDGSLSPDTARKLHKWRSKQ